MVTGSFIAIEVVTTGVEQSCIYWHSGKMVVGGGVQNAKRVKETGKGRLGLPDFKDTFANLILRPIIFWRSPV